MLKFVYYYITRFVFCKSSGSLHVFKKNFFIFMEHFASFNSLSYVTDLNERSTPHGQHIIDRRFH